MKLAIVGSQTVHPSIETVEAEVSRLGGVVAGQVGIDWVTEVICGCAPGGDRAGQAWAESRSIPVAHYPITDEDRRRWGKYLAPKMRNRRMAEISDVALAFWEGTSGGTADMVCRMVARHKPVDVVPHAKGRRPKRDRRG